MAGSSPKATPKKSETKKEVTDLFEVFGRDIDAEEAGVWEYVPNTRGEATDVMVHIRSSNSSAGRKYSKLLDRYTKDFRRKNDNRKPEGDEATAINVRAFLESELLLDWKNVFVGKKEVPFSEAESILSDPRFVQFFSILMNMVVDPAIFRGEAIKEETEKN